MFYNLVLNSYEAMSGRGELLIDIQRGEEKEWVISVRDTGPGMTKEVKKMLFQPFQSTKKGGTGLGLVIVQKIVESHGGRIQLKGELSQGAEFIIRLPITKR